MVLDPILSEVRRIREEYAQQFNGDVRAMMDDLRRRHAESDRQSVSREPKVRRKKTRDVKPKPRITYETYEGLDRAGAEGERVPS
jgi:hypothetical protein